MHELAHRRDELAAAALAADEDAHSARTEELAHELSELHLEQQQVASNYASLAEVEQQLRTQLHAEKELRIHAQAEVAQLSDAHIRMQELASRRDELATIAAQAEEAAAEAQIEELKHELSEAQAEILIVAEQSKSC